MDVGKLSCWNRLESVESCVTYNTWYHTTVHAHNSARKRREADVVDSPIGVNLSVRNTTNGLDCSTVFAFDLCCSTVCIERLVFRALNWVLLRLGSKWSAC